MELEAMLEEKPLDRFQFVVSVFLMLATIFSATVGYLEKSASLREDQSARTQQALAVQIMGNILQSGQRSQYELRLLAEYGERQQHALALQGAALQMTQDGLLDRAQRAMAEAEDLQAEGETIKQQSVLLTDPRYAPRDEQSFPNLEQFAADSQKTSLKLLKKQNKAADAAQYWGNKADAYVSILTLLAITLFLYGLSLIMETQILRYLFFGIGLIVFVLTLLGTLIVFAT
jgi:hypothetical protein